MTGSQSAEELLAEARKAFFVMFGFVALVWALQLANWADGYGLDRSFGIVPMEPSRLPDLFVAPFLHVNWQHLEANSGPLFIFGFLAAYRGVYRFLALTALVVLSSGLAVWFFQGSGSLTVGASGLVFGYFGYVVVRGLFDRRLLDILIGVVMAASFAYLLTIAVPGAPGVSWLAHLGGLLGGVVGAWLLRDRGDRPRTPPVEAGTEQPEVPALPGQEAGPRADLHKELGDLGLL